MRSINEFYDALIYSDSMSRDDGLPAIPTKSVDHVIMDPPYEEHVHETGLAGQYAWGKGKKKNGAAEKEALSFKAFTDADRDRVAKEVVRVCRGWIICFCGVEAVGSWQRSFIEAGAKRRTTCMWHKTDAAPKFVGDGPSAAFEPFVLAWAGEGRSVWNGGGKPGVYSYPKHITNKWHETQKPLILMQQLVLDFTMPGQHVIDPFMGAGTTCSAAKSLGRRFTGWEIDLDTFRGAHRDVSAVREQTRMEQMVHLQRVRPTGYGDQPSKPKPGAQGALLIE